MKKTTDCVVISFKDEWYGESEFINIKNKNRIAKYLYYAVLHNELEELKIIENFEFKPKKIKKIKALGEKATKEIKKKSAHYIHRKPAPMELVQEMLLKGNRKVCDKGYIYLEYKGYREYMHRLVVLNNGINIPKGFGIHHIDHNKLNNSVDNLIPIEWNAHRELHRYKKLLLKP